MARVELAVEKGRGMEAFRIDLAECVRHWGH